MSKPLSRPKLAKMPSGLEEPQHPMRVMPLRWGLEANLWSTKPNFFGPVAKGARYDMSRPATKVGHFISHAWPDRAAKKVAMLREFLCLSLGRHQDFRHLELFHLHKQLRIVVVVGLYCGTINLDSLHDLFFP